MGLKSCPSPNKAEASRNSYISTYIKLRICVTTSHGLRLDVIAGSSSLCRAQEIHNPKQETNAALFSEFFTPRSRVQQHHQGIASWLIRPPRTQNKQGWEGCHQIPCPWVHVHSLITIASGSKIYRQPMAPRGGTSSIFERSFGFAGVLGFFLKQA